MNINDLDPNEVQQVSPPSGQSGSGQLNINSIDPSLLLESGQNDSNTDSTPTSSDTGFSPADIPKAMIAPIVTTGTRVGQVIAPAFGADQSQVNNSPITTKIPGLGSYTVPPMQSQEQAAGEFAQGLANPLALMTGDIGVDSSGVGPTAASKGMAMPASRILTMGASGVASGAGQAMEENESPGQVALAGATGGTVGLALGGGSEVVQALLAKGVSQSLADAAVSRYQSVFQPTEDEIQAGSQYSALVKMQKNDPQLYQTLVDTHPNLFNKDGTLVIPQSLASKALKDLPSGSTQDLLDKVNTNLEVLKSQLNTVATQSGVSFQLSPADTKNYISLLNDLKDQYSNTQGEVAFDPRASQAQTFITQLQRNGGTMGPSDVLELRQFLDDQRKSPDFNKPGSQLSQRGGQFKGAADKLRAMFNDQVPGAKPIMSKFVDTFDERDALLSRATKEAKSTGFSLSKLNVVNDALKNTNFNTTTGRLLQGASNIAGGIDDKISSVLGPRALSSVTGPIRVAGRTLIPTAAGAAGKLISPPNQ